MQLLDTAILDSVTPEESFRYELLSSCVIQELIESIPRQPQQAYLAVLKSSSLFAAFLSVPWSDPCLNALMNAEPFEAIVPGPGWYQQHKRVVELRIKLLFDRKREQEAINFACAVGHIELIIQRMKLMKRDCFEHTFNMLATTVYLSPNIYTYERFSLIYSGSFYA